MRAIIFLTLISVFSFSSVSDCIGQKEDHVWLFGYGLNKAYLPNGDRDTTWGSTDINFNFDPPRIVFNPVREANFFGTNTSVCDKDGNLMYYSNGMQIFSGLDHSILEDTIAFSLFWKDNSYINDEKKLVTLGFPYPDFALMFPDPKSVEGYYLFYEYLDITSPSFDDWVVRNLLFSKIEIDPVLNAGKVVFKDSILIKDTLAVGGLTACRHANGRDWWLVFPTDNFDKIYKYLIDVDGIHLVGVQQFEEDWPYSVGQAKFSPDGKKLCYVRGMNSSEMGCKVLIFDFDRCSGMLSNKKSEYITGQYGLSKGMAYSSDSRYLYVSNSQWIYQYDLTEEDLFASRKAVATYDGYGYLYPGTIDTTWKYPTTLGWMGNGPDGRIYISTSAAANRKMGVMHYPNEAGEACDVRQHSLHITTSYARGMPTFPNYRLGPLDGSECDTLGLNNNPIAKFRYEQDTIDYLKVRFTDLSYFRPESWHWDFGDGTTTTGTTAIERYPYHTFPHNGTYEVCLTVSNENSSNTACRTLTFGTASTTTPEVKEIDVNLYPNPVKDQLNLTIYDYLPQKGMIQMFDARGNKVLSTRVYHGWNNVDMTRLLPGVYVYNIVDKGVVLKSGKVVKGE